MIKFEKRGRPAWGAVRRHAGEPPRVAPAPTPPPPQPRSVETTAQHGGSPRQALAALRAQVVTRVAQLFPGESRVRFALDMPEGTLHFFMASLPQKGKWQGAIFLSEQASDDFYRVRGQERETYILRAMLEGLLDAVVRYGLEIGVCGVCGRTLTDDQSREAGIGPVCLRKMGAR